MKSKIASPGKGSSLIIVLHEIYGINNHISATVEKFRLMGFDAVCPDLTGLAEPFSYDRQPEAYAHFINNVGFANAARRVRHLSSKAKNDGYRQVILCGFSVGATVAWLCSENKSVDGIICYYGSRIRDYAGVNPACPGLLIFPSCEESFDVKSFSASVKKPGVQVSIIKGRHGFADRFSSSYNEESTLLADAAVKSFLETFGFLRSDTFQC